MSDPIYLHIGNGKSLRVKKIVGIFDLDSATVSGVTKNFLSSLSEKGKVDYIDDDLPRSFLLLSDKKRKNESVCLSRISPQGLKLRSDSYYDENSER